MFHLLLSVVRPVPLLAAALRHPPALRHTPMSLAARRARLLRGAADGAAAPTAEVDLDADELMRQRLQKAAELRGAGLEPFAYGFSATHSAQALAAEYSSLADGEEDLEVDVAVCGRVLARRVFGKLAFFTLQDATGTVQLYLEKKALGEGFKSFLALSDGGDIVGARGGVKRTQKGELSVFARECTILTKALRPLPDKWAGLTDVTKRYRQRYLDMIVNPQVRRTFAMRARITSFIRRYLDDRGFLEIETPALHAQPGGADAKVSAARLPARRASATPPARSPSALRDLPQRAVAASHSADRARTLPQAAGRRRLRPRV